MKTCKRCQIEQPFENFDTKNCGDGYKTNCRHCRKVMAFIHRRTNDRKRSRYQGDRLENYNSETKFCSKCEIKKPINEYHADKRSSQGTRSTCKPCNNKERSEYYQTPEGKANGDTANAKYRADRIQASPPWASTNEHQAKIKTIYKNRPEGDEIDHIIPLNGKTFSGLHVHWNLQYLTKEQNRAKRNNLPSPEQYRAK